MPFLSRWKEEMKIYKIILLPDTLKDLTAATDWYEKKQTGLGKRLLTDIRLSILALKQNPFIGSVKYLNIRTISCSKFPYSLHYPIDTIKGVVIITSLFHLHRKPLWD